MRNFLGKLIDAFENHISDATFEVNTLNNLLNMSRMQLFRKIKALTNLTPGNSSGI
jgi:hypothetical protein